MGGGSGNAVFPHVTLSVMPRRGEDGSGLLFPTAGGSANRHAGGRSAGGGRAARRSGKDAPLADRIRPETLDELLGQDEVLGEGRPLRRAIEADRLPSIILWGPPGSGKTTLAHVIRRRTSSHFEAMSAVLSGVKELRELLKEAEDRLAREGRRTILFIDEIHRYNKAQQDALLSHVESGDVTLIGATTENPSFEVNAALLSRCRVVVLKPLDAGQLESVLRRALAAAAPGGLTYAYALYDLGRSLRLAGDPRAAVPILYRRLQIPDQTGVVRLELQRALQALGQQAQTRIGPSAPAARAGHGKHRGNGRGDQGDQGD